VRSHFVNQLPANVVQSGPILSLPGPAGSGGGKTLIFYLELALTYREKKGRPLRKGSHVMIVSPAWSEKLR
jgi:hypothetical protein